MPGADLQFAPRWVNLLAVGISAVAFGMLEFFKPAWYAPALGVAAVVGGVIALSRVQSVKRRYGNR